VHRELGDGSGRGILAVGSGQRRPNQRAVEGPPFVNRRRLGSGGLLRRGGRRHWVDRLRFCDPGDPGNLGCRCRLGRLRRGRRNGRCRLGRSRHGRAAIDGTAGHVGQHLVVEDRGGVFLLADRGLATLVHVLSVAGRATRLPYLLFDNCHDGVVG
jgi:hypothetical protein